MLDSFLSLFKIFEKRKFHNMFSLILNLRFKNLHLVSSFLVMNMVYLLLNNMTKKVISYA